eukprot:gene9959-7835_t
MSSFETASSVTPVREAHALDGSRLLNFLRTALPHIVSPSSSLEILQFSHGQSNPTYLLQLSPAASGGDVKLVLRKKPGGKILASAHAVEREHQVLSALSHGTKVPVPQPVLLCEDSSVLGTPFYVMEFANGHVFLDPNLPQCDASTRRQLFSRMVSTLASLHSVDASSLNLPNNFGRHTNYCQRQLTRWSRQYYASVPQAMPQMVKAMPQMVKLISWLEGHIPAEDAQPSHPTVCHGDYRLDNLVFDQNTDGSGFQVRAVLDWELCTLGNPLADLAYNCMMYHLPAGFDALAHLNKNSSLPEGVPTEKEYLQMYCKMRGIQAPSPEDWAFYLALSLFRLSAIVAGVQARNKQGNASSAHADVLSSDAVVQALAETALGIISRASVSYGAASPSARSAAAPAMGVVTPAPLSGAIGAAEILGGLSPKVLDLRERLLYFMEEYVYPTEEVLEAHALSDKRWEIHPMVEELKEKAKVMGLWNLWLPAYLGQKLTHLLPLSAGNAVDQKLAPPPASRPLSQFLWPSLQMLLWLLSAATNIASSITRKPDGCYILSESSITRQPDGTYILSGVKWWTSGACDPRCAICIFMGKTDTSALPHLQQSMILVPMAACGVKMIRPMMVFGYDDAPHGHAEVHFNDVRVAGSNMLLGEGRGFEIAQGRLGPGRLHHCERLVGASERAIEIMAKRALQRVVFGEPLAKKGGFQAALGAARIDVDSSRLLVLAAAAALDKMGNKGARGALAIAKIAAPNAALRVIDASIQAHGGAGVSQDFPLARLYAAARTLRIADGPDEVHMGTIAKLELARWKDVKPRVSKL